MVIFILFISYTFLIYTQNIYTHYVNTKLFWMRLFVINHLTPHNYSIYTILTILIAQINLMANNSMNHWNAIWIWTMAFYLQIKQTLNICTSKNVYNAYFDHKCVNIWLILCLSELVVYLSYYAQKYRLIKTKSVNKSTYCKSASVLWKRRQY